MKNMRTRLSALALAVLTAISAASIPASADTDVPEESPAASGITDTYQAEDIPDISSKELIVKCPSGMPEGIGEDAYISSMGDLYLLGFETEEDAAEAYRLLYASVAEHGGFVAPNEPVTAADTTYTSDAQTCEDSDPVTELKEAMEVLEGGVTADPRVIALVDTGVNDTEGIIGAVSVLGDDPSDDNGHGTLMASVIHDINPDARLISIKALDMYGRGNAASVYAAIECAIEAGAGIINLSLYGRNTDSNAAVAAAIHDAVKAGITVVGSAGNDGCDASDYIPGSIEEAYIIGACNAEGVRLENSNYGATVDYCVYAESTSAAAAKFSAYISRYGIGAIDDTEGLIYPADDSPADSSGASGSQDAMDGFQSAADIYQTGIDSAIGYDYHLISNSDGYATRVTPANCTYNGPDMWELDTTGHTARYAGNNATIYGIRYKVPSGTNGQFALRSYLGASVLSTTKDPFYEMSVANGNMSKAITLTFSDAVTDGMNNMFDLQITIDRIQFRFDQDCSDSEIWGQVYLLSTEGGISGSGNNAPLVLNASEGIQVIMDICFDVLPGSSGVPVRSGGRFSYGFSDLDQPGVLYDPSASFGTVTYNGKTYKRLKQGAGTNLAMNDNMHLGLEGIRVMDGIYSVYTPDPSVTGTTNTQIGGNNGTGFLNMYAMYGSDTINYFCANVKDTSVTDGSDMYAAVNLLADTSSKFQYTASMAGTKIQSFQNGVTVTLLKERVMVRYQNEDMSWGEYSDEASYGGIVTDTAWGQYFSHTFSAGCVEMYDTDIYDSSFSVYSTSNESGDGTLLTSDTDTYTFELNPAQTENTWYIDVPRKITAKTRVRYELKTGISEGLSDYSGVTGSWSTYTVLDTQDLAPGSPYSYAYTQLDGGEWHSSACTDTGQSGRSFVISNPSVTGSVTYSIDVTRARYTVVYDPNGSQDPDTLTGERKNNTVSGTMEDSVYVYDISGALRPNTFVREGYEFAGWNTKADGSGTPYPDGYDSVLSWAEDQGSVILYAQWTKNLGTETLSVISEETGNPVPGVDVKLYKEVNGTKTQVGDIYTTDRDGRVVVTGLHWYDYTWECTGVPAGYRVFDDIGYSISHDHLINEDIAVLYMKHVTVILDSVITDIIPGEDAPSFLYRIEGTDAAGVYHAYNVLVDVDGTTLTGSSQTKDMFAGTYTVTQLSNMRYIPEGSRNVSNATPEGINAFVNVLDRDSAEVLFPYRLNNFGWFSSMHSIINELIH